ncbi:lipocalin family protein [Tenacibaculum halocynthiae]|uniref:lipocalin family protein n=1 Tax=Tenacibaculum halocynthiae TaxID=1254437 RepID=UPI003894DFC9
MKKAILLIAFLLSFSALMYSQEIKKSASLTSGKWRIESLKIGEEKEDLSNCKNSWMVFEKDGNYQLVIRKTEKKGQWKLLEDKKTIKFENEGDDTNGFQILKLNDKELLFSTKENDVVYTMTLKK